MRTLQISDDLDPNSSEGRRVLTISDGLIERGHEVTIVTALKNPIDKETIENLIDPKIQVIWHEPFFRFSKFSYSPKLYSILFDHDFDLIHAHSYRHYGTYVGSLLRLKKGVPFVMSPYGSISYESSPLFTHLYLLQDFLTRKYPVRYPDKILAETMYERNQIIDFGGDPEKIDVVYRDVDTTIFKKTPDLSFDKEPPVLFLGRVTPIKGIELIIDALPSVNRKINLWIAGPVENQAYLKKLQRRIKENSVSDRVRFLGKVPYNDVPRLYSSALTLVLPSFYENLGGVLLEAQACECPGITLDVGGMAEIIRDHETGFILRERSPELLAEKINLLADDAILKARMGSLGREFILSGFSTDVYVDRVLESYTKALSKV
ncbi:MAG: glycosyltransferase family 4 protein [Candidatus Bathyarchaeota archaeon]|nr:glycosyltransferase family 4 protein [Candidatus Bathyarchaeota archaeon]